MKVLILVGVIGAVAAGSVVGMDAAKASKGAAAARQESGRLENELLRQKELVEKTEKEEQALMDDLQPREALGVEFDKWQAEENKLLADAKTLRDAWDAAVAEMQAILKPLLASTETKPLPVLSLKSGASYRHCVLSGADGGQVTVKHADGVTKVAVKDLPFELVRRYYLNFNPVLPKELEEPDLMPLALVMPNAQPETPAATAAAASAAEAGPGKAVPEGTQLRRAEQKVRALNNQLKAFQQALEYQQSLTVLFSNPPNNEREKIHFAKGLENAQIAEKRYTDKIKAAEDEIAKLDGRISTLKSTPGLK